MMMRRRRAQEECVEQELVDLLQQGKESKNDDWRLTRRKPNQQPVWTSSGPGRCTRCCKYFKNSNDRESTPCVWHPGNYTGRQNLDTFVPMWTCCKKTDEDSEGCYAAEGHVECVITQQAMQKMGISSNDAQDEELRPNEGTDLIDSGLAEKNTDGDRARRVPDEDAMTTSTLVDVRTNSDLVEYSTSDGENDEISSKFWIHEYKSGETLPGLALVYNRSVQSIKRANRIHADFLDPGRKVLYIPKFNHESSFAPTVPGKPCTANFARRLIDRASVEGLSMSMEEAQFYISDNDNDVCLALRAAQEDANWANNEPYPLYLQESDSIEFHFGKDVSQQVEKVSQQVEKGKQKLNEIYGMFKEAFTN